jgi:signal transduction histidine kinase
MNDMRQSRLNIFKFLGSYLKSNRTSIIIVLITYGVFLMLCALYSLPLEAVGYAALLSGIFIMIVEIISFTAYYRRHLLLERLKNCANIAEAGLPVPRDQIEQDYQELIRIIDESRSEIIDEKDKAYTDMVDYYTIWVHQIKTPIAAMRLLLQSDPTEANGEANSELLDQLFRIEQYVEMVLQYLRMESINADLLISKYPLDDIVRRAIRKYAQSFIRKKIRLDYQPLNHEVLTDAKWLTFVIEQILSNALKYTPNSGTVSIYMDPDLPDTLVIEDTGVGIAPEDLPRVFERGFTGYNGRIDRKASGIGLSLSRRILSKLSHTISIDSTVGKGTKVKVGLDAVKIAAD